MNDRELNYYMGEIVIWVVKLIVGFGIVSLIVGLLYHYFK